jgi:hypothetical protein
MTAVYCSLALSSTTPPAERGHARHLQRTCFWPSRATRNRTEKRQSPQASPQSASPRRLNSDGAATSDDEAGTDSPHLDAREQTQAAEHAAPAAMVIHEIVREEGELELRRRNAALLWSLPDEPWRRLLDSPGYCVGFVIVILGRQQMFTESTLTAVLPLMMDQFRVMGTRSVS